MTLTDNLILVIKGLLIYRFRLLKPKHLYVIRNFLFVLDTTFIFQTFAVNSVTITKRFKDALRKGYSRKNTWRTKIVAITMPIPKVIYFNLWFLDLQLQPWLFRNELCLQVVNALTYTKEVLTKYGSCNCHKNSNFRHSWEVCTILIKVKFIYDFKMTSE